MKLSSESCPVVLCRYGGVFIFWVYCQNVDGLYFLFNGTASKAGNKRKRPSLT
jgi:hypothetical protein